MTTVGFPIIAMANETLRLVPPLSFLVWRSAYSSRPRPFRNAAALKKNKRKGKNEEMNRNGVVFVPSVGFFEGNALERRVENQMLTRSHVVKQRIKLRAISEITCERRKERIRQERGAKKHKNETNSTQKRTKAHNPPQLHIFLSFRLPISPSPS